jgi:formate dehydrogenase maturation protein FdhE
MDRADLDKNSDKKAREDEQIFCPKCASTPHGSIKVLDTRSGKTYRLFRCQCGQLIWNE